MADLLLFAGILLGFGSVILAVTQLLKGQPPRAAAILLVVSLVAVLAWAVISPA